MNEQFENLDKNQENEKENGTVAAEKETLVAESPKSPLPKKAVIIGVAAVAAIAVLIPLIILLTRHKHDFGKWETVAEASCTESGEKIRTCDCGESETKKISSLGHSYIEGVCERCGKLEGASDDCKHENVTVLAAISANCTETGLTEGKKCSDCGVVTLKQEIIPQKSHKYTNGVCEACGEKEPEPGACAHKNLVCTKDGYDPTCTTSGLTSELKCRDCGEIIYSQSVLEALGHHYTAGVCETCGYVLPTSEGLEFALSDDGTYYELVGLGSCMDESIVIPATYMGLPVKSIGDSAFAIADYEDYRYIRNIIISNGVTAIGNYAFKGNHSIESLYIPDSVKSIGEHTFADCETYKIELGKNNTAYKMINGDLYTADGKTFVRHGFNWEQGVVFAEGVTSIASHAFSNYQVLKSITIPDTVTSIGESAFYWCYQMTELDIPDTVKSIGDNAFSMCDGLVSVNIGSGIKKISNGAFSGCSNLTSIVVPDTVKSIGEGAFSGCGLTNIVIGKNVETIGAQAFECCDSLYKVTNRSKNKFTFGSGEFGGIMTNAKLLVDKDGNTSYDSSSNKYIETKDGLLFEKVYGEYVLIAYLGSETTVTLPATIEGKTYTISNIRGVRDVILSEGFLNINDDAFSYCWSLTSITIPGSVKNIGNFAFIGCGNLKTVNLGEGIESIGDEAFRDCYSMAEIILPDSVKSLGYCAFSNTGLNKLVIGAGIENLGDAFAYSHIYNIEVSKNNPAYKIIGKNLYSKDGKTFVYYAGNWEFNTFTVPEGVEIIGDYAFSDNYYLESIVLPSSLKVIGNEAFCGSEYLRNIAIPNGVTTIGDSAFTGCYALTSIEIPNSVTTIGDGAFAGCYALTSIEIPNGVITIGDYAFAECYALTSIEIPNSVTTIGENTFYLCTSLETVVIGIGVKTIEYGCFEECYSITDVYYRGTRSEWEEIDIGWYNNYLTNAEIHYNYVF